MFGTVLSSVIQIATLPVDAAESAVDVAFGGNGSKSSKEQGDINMLSKIRDAVCEELEDLD